jgi:hypothetical protein
MTQELLLGMADLAGRAESIGLTVFEFDYSERIFGSWKLTLGSIQKSLQFVWDGKESYLTCATSAFSHTDDPSNWEFIANGICGSNTTVLQIVEFAWSTTNDQFAQ